MKIRVVKTASKARAVQVVRYQNNKRIILRHIGSAHTDAELEELMRIGHEWMKNYSDQLSIFPDENPNKLLHINHCTFIGVQYRYFYQQIRAVQDKVGFDGLPPLLNDLVGIRIFEPASKLRSLELLEQFFGISHSRKTYYRIAPACIELKQIVEQKVVDFAKEHYSFDFDIVFYDVTTLYFETFEEDELRKNGFSKDNKSQQPQILVALVVTKEGFPIAYEIFSGNTFEGHTLIPVIKDFIDRNKINTFTVVADAAMISSENIAQLTQHGLNYIVGARMGNLSAELLETVDKQIARQDDMSIRIKTELGDLICSYSSLRYRKDLYEMNKQIEKAKQAVETPSKTKKLKFTKTDKQQLALNQETDRENQKAARHQRLLHQPARTDGKQPNNHGALSPALQNRTGFQGIEERFANQAHFSFQGTAHQVAHIDMLYGIGYLKAHRNQSRRIDKKVLGRGQKSSRWTNPKPYFRKISYNSSPAYRKNARNRL
jgi:hypothetical protein